MSYNINAVQQSACVWFDSVMVDSFASLSYYTPVGQVRLHDGSDIELFVSCLVPELLRLLVSPPGFNCWVSFGSNGVELSTGCLNALLLSSPYP